MLVNKTNDDTIFTPEPDIEMFLEKFEAYTERPNLRNYLDELIAFKMSLHLYMRDARIVLSSTLNQQTNEDNITFTEVT